MLISGEYPIRVRYTETDAMGIVHHSNYVNYAEVGRMELLRNFGTTYKELEERGVMMPVIEVVLKYHSPAYYDDILTIKISTERKPTVKMVFNHQIYNQNGVLINSGHVTLAFMDSVTRRPCRPPMWFCEVFEKE